MIGTSSDVAFADAYLKGVKGLDAPATYDAALKNATVVPRRDVGRKGLDLHLPRLHAAPTPAGVSWALEGYVNDYGIANMAEKAGRGPSDAGADRGRYRGVRSTSCSRSQNYVNMFTRRSASSRAAAPTGAGSPRPRTTTRAFWGHEHDYTETDGWGFAFHAPQDGQGLATLRRPRRAGREKLDTFFATPDGTGVALAAENAVIGGAVLLRHGFAARGGVSLLGATIDSNVECKMDKCWVDTRPGTEAWRVFWSVFSFVGKLVTSLALLTYSGVLKPKEEA